MTTYQFRTWIWIEAKDEQEALDIYDVMSDTPGVSRIYCHEWMEEKLA